MSVFSESAAMRRLQNTRSGALVREQFYLSGPLSQPIHIRVTGCGLKKRGQFTLPDGRIGGQKGQKSDCAGTGISYCEQ